MEIIDWNILGIEPTQDKEKIRKAYHEKLKTVNPEDDAEGFMKLRKAYEDALKWNPNKNDTEENDEFPAAVNKWIEKAEDIYDHYSKRINIKLWENLLNEDICLNLELRPEMICASLNFFADKAFVLPEVVRLFNDRLGWQDYREELLEVVPEEYLSFLDHLMSTKPAFEYLKFEDIDDNKNYDLWFQCFFEAGDQLRKGKSRPAERIINKMERMKIKNPSINILKLNLAVLKKENKDAEKYAEELKETFPENTEAQTAIGNYYLSINNKEKALEMFIKAAKSGDDGTKLKVEALKKCAECCMELQKFEECYAVYYYIFEKQEYMDKDIEKKFKKLCICLEEKYMEEFIQSEDPEDFSSYLEFAQKTGNLKQAENMLKKYEKIVCEKTKDDLEMYSHLLNSIGEIYFEGGHFKKSLKIYKELMSISTLNEFENLPEDYLYRQCALNEYNLGKFPEALENINKAISIVEKSEETSPILIAEFYKQKGKILYSMYRNEDAIMAFGKVLEIKQEHSEEELIEPEDVTDLCRVIIEEGGFAEAETILDEFFEDIFEKNAEYYALKLNIMYENDRYHEMKQLIKILKKQRITSSEIMLNEVRLLNGTGDAQQALIKGKNLLNMHEFLKNEYNIISDLMYEISMTYSELDEPQHALEYIESAIRRTRKADKSRKEKYIYSRAYYYRQCGDVWSALEDYKKLAKRDPENPEIAMRQAEIYENMDQFESALRLYKKALKFEPEHPFINFQIAELYYKMFDFNKAVKYYTKQLKIREDSYYYFCRGVANDRLKNIDQALKDYEKAIELDEFEGSGAYNNAGRLYVEKGEFEKGISYLKTAIKRMPLDPDYYYYYDNIIYAYIKLKDFKNARKYLNEAKKKFGSIPEIDRRESSLNKLINKTKAAKCAAVTASKNTDAKKGKNKAGKTDSKKGNKK